jgi:hypothetical protein
MNLNIFNYSAFAEKWNSEIKINYEIKRKYKPDIGQTYVSFAGVRPM